jgi:hypothetical protein
LDKLETFPKEDQEKKQLDEIAHLYFSTPAEQHKDREDPAQRQTQVEAFPRSARALFVYCTAGQSEYDLCAWFLFNLAVTLKILNGPVLLIGSEETYERRFLFGFRPDRERFGLRDRAHLTSSNFGPMGVCLLDGRSLTPDSTTGYEPYGSVPQVGGKVSFRYILSDEMRMGTLCGATPGLVVLVVTPATRADDLLSREEKTEGKLFPRMGHVGIVVEGAGCAEEANALYLYWQGKLVGRREGELVVEDFGMFPAAPPCPPLGSRGSLSVQSSGVDGEDGDFPLVPRFRGDRLRGNDMICGSRELEMASAGVLESPDSARARFCQSTATLIRRKRSEMVSRFSR